MASRGLLGPPTAQRLKLLTPPLTKPLDKTLKERLPTRRQRLLEAPPRRPLALHLPCHRGQPPHRHATSAAVTYTIDFSSRITTSTWVCCRCPPVSAPRDADVRRPPCPVQQAPRTLGHVHPHLGKIDPQPHEALVSGAADAQDRPTDRETAHNAHEHGHTEGRISASSRSPCPKCTPQAQRSGHVIVWRSFA